MESEEGALKVALSLPDEMVEKLQRYTSKIATGQIYLPPAIMGSRAIKREEAAAERSPSQAEYVRRERARIREDLSIDLEEAVEDARERERKFQEMKVGFTLDEKDFDYIPF